MSFAATDEFHLRRALQLAEEAAAFASPNPTVGCVLALGARVLGEGAHRYDSFDHAEIAALKQADLRQPALNGTGFSPSITLPISQRALAPEGVRGATAYITLEPCAHQGRTPPCADALIAAGITRCVIATVDPNPLVRGAGVTKLRAAGVEVAIANPDSPLAQHARTLNDAFAFSIQHNRPFVTLKAALSADGFLAPPPSARTAGTPHWLTGPAARADVQQLRHNSDAILTGIGTVLADNPSLTDRTGLPRRRPLLRVILDPDLRLRLNSTVISTEGVPSPKIAISTEAPQPKNFVISTEAQPSGETPVLSGAKNLLIFCRATAPADRATALISAGAEIIRLKEDSRTLNLNAVLTELTARRILSVLVEAGPTLNAAFLSTNLADKLILYTAPANLGPGSLPFATGIASPHDIESKLTHIIHATFPHGNAEDSRLTGYLHNPWTGIAELSS